MKDDEKTKKYDNDRGKSNKNNAADNKEEVDEDEEEVEIVELQPISDDDERAELDAELARIDASWEHRTEPSKISDDALVDLESKLSELDI